MRTLPISSRLNMTRLSQKQFNAKKKKKMSILFLFMIAKIFFLLQLDNSFYVSVLDNSI